jgi:hypothetical protein
VSVIVAKKSMEMSMVLVLAKIANAIKKTLL